MLRLAKQSAVRFDPILPPKDYTPLNFRPTMLTHRILWSLVLFYLATLGLLAYLFYRSHLELVWRVRNVNYYLAARYLPAVIGVVAITLFRSTVTTLKRMLPFFNMADQKKSKVKDSGITHTVCARYFPNSHSFFSDPTPFMLFGVMFIGFTIAFKATLFSVQETGDGTWLIAIRPSPAIYLCASYLLMFLITTYIAIKYGSRNTGLKKDWDPTSLADIILLFATVESKPTWKEGLNFERWHELMKCSGARYRLGYWKITNLQCLEPSVVYGIRRLDTPDPRKDAEHMSNFESQMNQQGRLCLDCRQGCLCLDCSSCLTRLAQAESLQLPRLSPQKEAPDKVICCQKAPYCSHYPYRKAPFALTFSQIILMYAFLLVLAASLACALLRIWTHKGIIFQSQTWIIQSNDLPAFANGTQVITSGEPWAPLSNPVSRLDKAAMIRDSLAVIFLRVVPIAGLGMVSNGIAVLDIHHRWVQPFTNMYRGPSSVTDSLLLDYMTVSPLEVLPQAWTNKHYKVLYFGILSALNWVPPLTITGLCSVTETGSQVIVQVSPVAACLAIFWALLYAVSLTTNWAPPERKLPRICGSLYDLFTFFYASRLRWLPEFGHAAFSKTLTKADFHAHLLLARHEFLFGLVAGQETSHHGFDIASHVIRIKPVRRFRRTRPSDRDADPEAIQMDTLSASESLHDGDQPMDEDSPASGRSSAIQ